MANFMTPLVGKNHMQLETLKASLLKQMQDLKRFEDGGKSSILRTSVLWSEELVVWHCFFSPFISNDNCDIISDIRTAEHSSALSLLLFDAIWAGAGTRHQLQHRELATWERSQQYHSQAVMWAMFDKAKPYTLHIWYYIHTKKLLMQQLPLALLLIRLCQVFSNLLVLIWRDEVMSNNSDRSGARIVILSVTSPASPTFWTSQLNQE